MFYCSRHSAQKPGLPGIGSLSGRPLLLKHSMKAHPLMLTTLNLIYYLFPLSLAQNLSAIGVST